MLNPTTEIRPAPRLGTVHAVKLDVERVFQNLLENAIQQDARMLPARVLLGHALIKKGHYKAAKDAIAAVANARSQSAVLLSQFA